MLGPIGLGYDRGNDRVLVQLEELVATDEDDDDATPMRPPTAATSGCT